MNPTTRRRFVLLDRDGTINMEHHYLARPDQIELLPEAVRGLQFMQSLGLGLVIVTNQSAIERGYFDERCLNQIHQRLIDLLAAQHVHLSGIYYCPHTPDDACTCRKPATGLVLHAAQALNFVPQETFVIGDKPCDMDLAQNLGATAVLVRTGYGAEHERDKTPHPDYVADNLYDAALRIQSVVLGNENS